MGATKPFRVTRPIAQLRQGRNDWYRIENSAGAGQPTQAFIYEELGYFGVTAQDFINDLQAVTGPVELHLNSPGGDVFEGLAIYGMLRQRGDVDVIIEGLAASIASVIAMGGKTLRMSPGSQLMMHDAFTMAAGNAADLRETADLLDAQSDNIAEIYAERAGGTAEDWRARMQATTWYTASTAVAAGLADSVISGKAAPDQDPAAQWDLSIFAKAPSNADGTGYQPQPYKREAGENTKCPSCGKFNDEDSSYCGQCGTKLAGRTDVTEAPGSGSEPMDDKLTNASVDNSPWDGSKAMANGAASDDPAKFYAGICAGQKAGDKSTQAAWALPYKYHPGDAPNAAGVRNALSRLPQTEGLTNKAEAQSLLERLMKQINPDSESADDLMDPGALQSLFTLALEGGKKA